MQKKAIENCQQNGIKVNFRHPLLSESSSWKGAFLTSASRGVLPIVELRIDEENSISQKRILFKATPLIEKLKDLVVDSFTNEALQILD